MQANDIEQITEALKKLSGSGVKPVAVVAISDDFLNGALKGALVDAVSSKTQTDVLSKLADLIKQAIK